MRTPRVALPLVVSQDAHAALHTYAHAHSMEPRAAAVQLLSFALLRQPRPEDLPILYTPDPGREEPTVPATPRAKRRAAKPAKRTARKTSKRR